MAYISIKLYIDFTHSSDYYVSPCTVTSIIFVSGYQFFSYKQFYMAPFEFKTRQNLR